MSGKRSPNKIGFGLLVMGCSGYGVKSKNDDVCFVADVLLVSHKSLNVWYINRPVCSQSAVQ